MNKKIISLFTLLILLLTFNVFADEDIIDNNINNIDINNTIKEKIIEKQINVVIDDYEDFVSSETVIFIPILDEINDNIDDSILIDNNTYYNEFGGIIRDELDNSSIVIEDKLISVMDYNSTSELFEVSMWVGTDGVKYAIKHDNKSLNYNYIASYGEYLGEVISKDGYIYYNTDKFSSQIATIPSYYQEGFLTDSGNVDGSGNILYTTSIDSNDILELDLLDYYTGIEGFNICDYYGCYMLDSTEENQQYYLGYNALLTEFPTGSNPILSDFTDINVQAGYTDYNVEDVYAFKLGAYNNEIQLNLNSDDNTNYYTSFYLNYFFPNEPPIYNYRGDTFATAGGGFITSQKFVLSSNPSFMANSFSSDLITLDSDENFGFKINSHFRNYNTWGFRLTDDEANPLSSKELTRTTDGCLSYTGSEIDIQICSDDNKADMIYINTKGVSFDGNLELYVLNSVYDDAFEVAYDITIDVNSPNVAPTLDNNINDIVLGYYDYNSVDIEDYFSGYTSFNVNINNDDCDIGKTVDTGLSSTCEVNGVTYVIYPSGLITMESTNIDNGNIPIVITTTNSFGSVDDTFTLSVGENVDGLLLDLIGYWSLDDSLLDSSGNGNTLISHGATYTGSGKINGGYSFDGDNDVLQATPITYTQELSQSFWFNTDDIAGFVLSADKNSPRDWYIQITATGEISYANWESGTNRVLTSSGAGITQNTWYHVVTTRDNSETKIYFNGVLVGTLATPYTWDINNNVFDIGNRQSDFALDFDGEIDEVGLWGKTLSQTEVTELYNGGVGLGFSSFGGGSSAIPPSITELDFEGVTLLPEGELTLDMNDYFVGYNNIELKYYSTESSEWFNIDLTFNDGVIENSFGDITIKLEDGYSVDTSQTIFMTVQGNSMVYDDLVYITASNDVGSTTEQNFNVFVDYTIPDGQLPENILTFSNIGLEYEDFENLNLNDYYSYYDYITLTIGLDEITVYLDGTNDFGEITNANYNITLTNLGTFIALNIVSSDSNEEVEVNIQAFNDDGSDEVRTFTLSINEEGELVSDIPSWFPSPPESQKLYYAVAIMIIFIVGIAFIGASDDGMTVGLMAFAIIGLFALFLMFTIVGWLPIWILILIIVFIVGYVSFVAKNTIGG